MDSLKLVGKFKKTTYQGTNGFSIATFEPSGETVKTVIVNERYGTFSVKGSFPSLKKGEEYQLNVSLEDSEKYGVSYVLQFVKPNRDVNFEDKKSFKEFLQTIVSEKIAENIVNTIDNPRDVLESGNLNELIKVKGVGEKSAQKIFDNYEMHKDYSEAYIKLGKFGLDTKVIGKIVKHFKSVDKAIEMVMENPYALTMLSGYGFKKCDEIFLKVHPNEYGAEVRVKAYIRHMMNEDTMNNGNTWIGLSDAICKVQENIGVDRFIVAKILGDMIKSGDSVVLTDEDTKPRIGNKKHVETEDLVSKHLMRLLTSENVFSTNGLKEAIEKEEEKQGWEFTGQQKMAIGAMAKHKVILLEGLAGSGKSTSLKVLLDFYSKLNYTYAQTALSGKASSNLALITGKEGSTIHRLLGINFENGGFVFNDKNKLPYDIIIIDEISMVDASIFYSLISAMKNTAKLIMVGDSEQLEAIGVPIMKPLIESEVIPRIMLSEIHRQAKKSAIVTHSINVRHGSVPIKPISGITTHGELQDLSYNVVDSDSDIALEVSKEFHKKVKSGIDIMDIQIISPVKSKGDASCQRINSLCQKIYNGDTNKDCYEVKVSESYSYTLREGDKVINVKNNYNSVDRNGRVTPVFNGSIGIVKGFEILFDEEIEKNRRVMVVDFDGIGEIVFPERECISIELAYCITIHKSQGMGVKHIIIAYPFAYTLANRQSLYTAITRAKDSCMVVIEYKTLKYAVLKDSTKKKRTYLSDLLKKLNKSYQDMKSRVK